jgi:Zn-dependent M28 family amino/carboxypeptidase
MLSASIIIPILLMVSSFQRFSSLWQIAWVPMALIVITAILLFESEFHGTALVGANDNASGVAALFAVATALKNAHVDNVETWFLFTTGEEAGSIGMKSFLDENSFEPDETYFINVDDVGAGKIHFTRSEGLLRFRKSSTDLVRMAGEIAEEHPDWAVKPADYRLFPTDQFTALRQGYRASAILGLDEHAIPPNWHQRTDTVESVDLNNVQIAADLALELIKRVDAEAVRGIEETQEVRLPLTDTVAH